MQVKSACFIFELAPCIAGKIFVEGIDIAARASHHNRAFTAGKTSGRETVGFSFAAVIIGKSESVTHFVQKNMLSRRTVSKSEHRLIGEDLPVMIPVAAHIYHTAYAVQVHIIAVVVAAVVAPVFVAPVCIAGKVSRLSGLYTRNT